MTPNFCVHGESTKFGGRIGRTGARDYHASIVNNRIASNYQNILLTRPALGPGF